jgi:chemotaxis protein MotA
MEKGNMTVLLQPAELVIIGGAALGTVLVANPPHILKAILSGMTGVLKGSGFTRQRYLDTLKMFYDLFSTARKGGLAAIEADIEDPSKSRVFSAYPKIMSDLAQSRNSSAIPCGPPPRACLTHTTSIR